MKKVLLLLLFLFTATTTYADDISISADVDKTEIDINDQIALTITVSGSVSNIPQPRIASLGGFTAYSSGRSQNISIINGQVSSSVTFTYILVPNDTGEYELGPFTIDYGGKTYSAGPVSVRVNPRSGTQAQPTPPSYPQTPSEPGQPQANVEGRGELFIETYVDKLRSYVNEQITLTFAFYQAVNLFENPVYSPPSTTGFWTEDLPPQKKYYKMIDGRRYLVTEIKTALFATSPGEFTIGPARLEASVEDLENFYSRSPFDIFDDPFSMFRRGKPVVLTTNPIKVEILPLPEQEKPAGFKGDVGQYDITAGIDKDRVEANEAVTLTIKIKGKGNIKTISEPDIVPSPELKYYDSGSSENIVKEDYVVQGEKVFERVVIPKEAGSFEIGPIEYSYFNPEEKRYIIKKIDPIRITATAPKKEPKEEGYIPLPAVTKEEVEILKRDISHIKLTPPRFRSKDKFLYKNKIFLFLNILPALILIFLYIYELHRERMRTDIGYARSRRAKRLAAKRLKASRNIMQKGDPNKFYAEIYRAAIEYIADKLNVPHPSITKAMLEKRLEEKGISGEVIEKLRNLFDVCDMARFASVRFTKEDMLKSLQEATDIITELERLG